MTVGQAQPKQRPTHAEPRANVSSFIDEHALARPQATAVIEHWSGRRISFSELGRRVHNIAAGLREMGICDGARAVLAVKPGVDFVALVFALFRAGAVPVVADPGMGKHNLLACIEEARPEALVGIPLAHALSLRYRSAFATVKQRVTVGRRWCWGGANLNELASASAPTHPSEAQASRLTPHSSADSPAAILFTSGATGVPKGVVYHHGIFVAQTEMIRQAYGIQPGEVDVACFALFALFSVAMGVTVVLPGMDFSRPAKCEPAKIVAAIREHNATMSFGSPAVWARVGPHLVDHNLRLPSLKRILIAGAPVPWRTLAMFEGRLAEGGDLHTPYGATESLPVSTISASEVLGETCHDTAAGKGTCVGKPMAGVEVRVVRATDGPIARMEDAQGLPPGEIGEIIVRSASTTREYFQRPEATARAKIPDGEQVWHRMGDTGWLDGQGRLWFTGRAAHVVRTAQGPMYPIPCEAIFNNHDAVSRSALVGVGPKGAIEPVIVIELHGGKLPPRDLHQRVEDELLRMAHACELTRPIKHVLFHKGLPVDVRHNAKINREALAVWAAGKLPSLTQRRRDAEERQENQW
jgi:olefin beta-lactone synthetase